MPDAAPHLFTIGHSNVALDDFLGLLQQHGIEAVADVRTVPRSRYVPGDEFYDEEGHVLYGRLAVSPAFQAGLNRVLAGAQASRVVLLCGEEDPSRCHRHLLIGRVLRERGVAVSHIRRDGRIETEADLDARETGGDPQATLFEDGAGQGPWRSPRPVPRGRPSPGSPAR